MKKLTNFLTLSRVLNDCRDSVGRLSTLFLLLFALSFGFNQEVKAATHYLAGDFTNWGTNKLTFSDEKCSVYLSEGDHEFQVLDGDTWTGNSQGGTITRNNCSNWTFYVSGGNCKINADKNGYYTFTIFDWANNRPNDGNWAPKVTVTYPDGAFHDLYVEYTKDGASGSWQKSEGDKDFSNVTSLIINRVYIKCWDNFGQNNTAWSKGGALGYKYNSNDSHISTGDPVKDKTVHWKGYDSSHPNNYEFFNESNANVNLISLVGGNSGKYTVEVWGKVNSTTNGWGDAYLKNGDNNFNWKYTILPPAVSNFGVTPSGAVAGIGTQEDPFIMPYNGTLTLTVNSLSQAHSDANSSLSLTGTGSNSKTPVKNGNVFTIGSIQNTNVYSVTISAKYVNNSDASLIGEESSVTYYYKMGRTSLTLDKNNNDASGSNNGSSNVNLGSKSFSPTAPTRTGYEPDGYYLENGCTTYVATASGTLKPSISNYTDGDGKWIYTGATATLYTKWKAKKYALSFDDQGATTAHTFTITEATYNELMPTFQSSKAPKKTGYTFQGYYTGTNGSGTKCYNADGTSAYTWILTPTETTTLYAYWAPNVNTIVFNANTGSGDQMTNQTFTYGQAAKALSKNTYTKTGYHFIGWARTVDGAVEYTDEQEITNITENTENVNLYAKWEANVTNITLYRNHNNEDATTYNLSASYDCTIGQVTGLTSDIYTRTGYTHNGIYAASSGGSYLMKYDNSAWKFNSTTQAGYCTGTKWQYEAGGDLNLYSQWSANKYTITFKPNGGSSAETSKQATYDSKANIATCDKPTRDNYNFAGYYLNAEGTGDPLYNAECALQSNVDGYTDASGNWIHDGNVDVYAKWASAGNYIVTLTAGNDATTAGTTSVNVQINTTTGLTTNITCPTKTGYTFKGYYTEASGAGKQLISDAGAWLLNVEGYIDSEGKWIYEGNVELKAKWDANKTQVTFDNQGATTEGTKSRQLTYNSTNFGDAFVAPAKTGYTFGGYFTETNGAGIQLISAEGAWIAGVEGYTADPLKWIKTTTDALTLYAKWTAITYTITYEGNGNTGGSTESSSHTYDVAKALTTNGFTRAYTITYEYAGATSGNETASAVANYTFANWTFNETNYTDGQEVTNLASTQGEEVTMTAQWNSGSVTLPTPTKTGYTFDGWYNNSSKIGEAGASYTPTADITLTANWTEIMSSLSTAVNAMGSTAGQANPTIANSVSAIGVTTTATITAEAAKAGYKFEGWTLTNCERTDGGAEKATTITVKGLGNTEAAAVTANYAEDLSTDWQLNFSHDGWHLYDFVKETGQSTGNVAYYSIDLEIDKSYEFEIRKKSSNTYYKNTGTMTATNCTNWTFKNEGDTKAWIKATVAGTYKFKIDFSGNNPVVSVIYPDVTCIQGDFDDWSRTAHAINEDNNWTTTVNITEDNANETLKFRLVWHGAYYSNKGTMTSENCTGWTFEELDRNYCEIKTTVAGNYTFSLNISDMKLSVSYPGENSRMVTVDNGETETQVDVKEVTETPLVAKQYLNGMRFNGWVVTNSEGVVQDNMITINHPENYSTHMHGAKADGLIVKATYTTQGIVYLNKQYIKNNWPGDVYVYFYKGAYWDNTTNELGSGSKTTDGGNCISTGKQMTRVSDKSDIYYYDYSGDNLSGRDSHIAFLDQREDGYANFVACQAIYRGDFQECSPMFVPRDWKYYYNKRATQGQAVYYQEGYWRTYGSTEAGLSLVFWKGKAKTIVPFTSDSKNDNTFTAKITISDVSNDTYFKLRCCGGDENDKDYWYGCKSGMSATSCTNYRFYSGNNTENENCGIGLTSTGDYVFTLSLADGQVFVSVEYPLSDGDYRLVSVTDGKVHDNGMFYKPSTDRVNTASFFITKDHTSVVKLQECTNATSVPAEWADVEGKSIATSGYETGIYNFTFTQSGENTTLAKLGEYDGDFYIRTAIAAGAWDAYKGSADNLLPYIEYGLDESQKFPFTHAYTNWVEKDKNVKFCIANDYSLCISDTLVGDDIIGHEVNADWLKNGANIRFMWNKNTNALSRAYISGSTNDEEKYLMLIGDANMFDTQGQSLTNNELKFTDKNNWVYQADIKAKPGCEVKLTAQYTIGSEKHVQYFMGSESTTRTIISGSATEKQYTMRAVYDFKTNRLTAGWVPEKNQEITAPIELGGDMLLVREHQGDANQITFSGSGKVSDIHHIYGVLTIKKDVMLGTADGYNNTPATNDDYARTMYWISFPFNVKISEIFGVDGYGQKWIMQKYRGDLRAQKGWFKQDTPTFWEFMEKSDSLNAYEGYLFLIDANYFNTEDADVWKNSATEANFYFPSVSGEIGIIKADTYPQDVDDHACSIDREFSIGKNDKGEDIMVNHMITDSYWNVIGVPAFQNTTAGATPISGGLNAYYEWLPSNNTYKAETVSLGEVTFKTMHAYMVQFGGTLTWSKVSVVSKAPYAYTDEKNYMIELFFNGNDAEDHTYINLADEASTDFVLNEDMMKIDNAGYPNIYSFAGNYNVAYNETKKDNQTVMLGVSAPKDGNYTFSMPKDFSGTAKLVDLVEGITTDLNVANYSVDLNKGTYNNRFQLVLEVEAKTPTSIEADGQRGREADGKTTKLLRNGNIYLINGGRVYNVLGVEE